MAILSHCGDDEVPDHKTDADVVLDGPRHDKLIDRVDSTLLTRPGNGGRTLFEAGFAKRETDGNPPRRPERASDKSVATSPRNRIWA